MNPWQNPSIELFGLRVDEPVTVITDVLVAAMGFIAYLNTASVTNNRSFTLYRYFFLFTAISTFVAAFVGHAFAYYIGFEYRMIGWVFGIIGVAFAQFAALYHTKESIGQKIFSVVKIISIVEIPVIAVILATKRTFTVVEIQAAFGLVIVVTVLESIHYSKTKSVFSLNMMFGIGLTVAAVVCHVGKLAISKWFNHMDLGHILMFLSLYVMYKGLKSEQKLNLVYT